MRGPLAGPVCRPATGGPPVRGAPARAAPGDPRRRPSRPHDPAHGQRGPRWTALELPGPGPRRRGEPRHHPSALPGDRPRPPLGAALRLRRPFPGFPRLTQVLGGYLTAVDSALVVGGDAVGPHRPTRRPGLPRRGRPPAGPARYGVGVPPVARVVPGTAAQNRVIDWLQFLAHVAARVPRGCWVHVFSDNLLTYLHPAVPAWIAAHPQVVVHLVAADRPCPAGSSRPSRGGSGPGCPRRSPRPRSSRPIPSGSCASSRHAGNSGCPGTGWPRSPPSARPWPSSGPAPRAGGARRSGWPASRSSASASATPAGACRQTPGAGGPAPGRARPCGKMREARRAAVLGPDPGS